MRARTVVQCFVLLGMMVFLAFVGEFMVLSFFEGQTPALYRVAPITSIPAWFKRRSAQEEAETPKVKRVALLLLNGKEFTGELVEEENGNGDWVNMKIDGNNVGFHRSEIKQMTEI